MTEGEALPEAQFVTQVYFEVYGQAQCLDSNVYNLEHLKAGMKITGPAIILNKTSTVLIEPSWIAEIDIFGNVEITHQESENASDLRSYQTIEEVPLDPIELSIFGHRFMSIAE